MADEQVPIPDGDTTIWRAYGQFVKNIILGPNKPTEGLDYLYVLTPTEYGLRGGRPIPDSVTNWNVNNFANSLQRTDSPLFSTAGLGYFESLEDYLNSVQVKEITQEQRDKIKAAKDIWSESFAAYRAERTIALRLYAKDQVAKTRKLSFQHWCQENDPEVPALHRQASLDETSYRSLQNKFYGSSFKTLSDRLAKIDTAATDNASNPGFNMPCYTMDYDINEDALKNDTRVDDVNPDLLVYKPLYAVSGFETACDKWIKGAAGPDTSFKTKLTQFSHNDWTELGYKKTISQQSNSFWFFFSRTSSSTNETETLKFSGSDWRSETEVTITASGNVLNFQVTPGVWDVNGLRRLFPTIRPDERDIALDLVRISRILVAYRVGIKITFSRSLRTQVRDMIHEARQDTEGGLRIFGFQFGSDSQNTSSFTRDVNSVKYVEESGELTLPPTPDGIPFVLGMLGRKITKDM
ncbi:MAG: hypothetical protein M1840_002432 [Geoglossum simile]|nr:MAG: hypothetical protein M1840_002432 [Geoglossum simile]